ncbi:hypothetical protein ACWGST_03045 [Agromyces sp. NPDC055520]
MNDQLAGAWLGVIGGVFGALFALAGVWLSEIGHQKRAKQAADALLSARAEDRRAELWQISLPAVGRVQELFATVVRLARIEDDEPGTDFNEDFPEWWKGKRISLDREIALLPSHEFREALTLAANGVDGAYALKDGWSLRHTVERAAHIGFDLASAWLRDECSLDETLHQRVTSLGVRLREIHETYAGELEMQLDPKGYGMPASPRQPF